MRREEIEALAEKWEAEAKRRNDSALRAIEEGRGSEVWAAVQKARRDVYIDTARMLREALARSDAARGPVIDSAALDAEIGPCDVCGRAASLCDCDS